MSAEPVYLPSGDNREGIEGFRVLAPTGAAVGEVAAVNRGREGLELVVQAGDAHRNRLFRAVRWEHVAKISLSTRTVMLTVVGVSMLQEAQTRPAIHLLADDDSVLRIVPPDPRVTVESEPGPEASSPRLLAAVAIAMLGMLALLAAGTLAGPAHARAAWVFAGSGSGLIVLATLVFVSQLRR
jgi:hypothetical protein